jgi:Mrp family chromosome partitioning ATPase
MSKIEKALNRAREARGGLQVVPTLAAVSKPAAAGTALVADRPAHPETIARMATGETRLLRADELAALRIIDINRSSNPVVQAFRGLRTRIIQASKGTNAVVLVTGVTEDSGSSFVAQNLGAAFAFDVAKTALVVDCNFKNPGLHRLIAQEAALGMIDYLQNPGLDIDKVIYPVGIPRLRVIPAGRGATRQAEFFTSAKMMRLMDTVRRRYAERFVILDGPPMDDAADVQILSEFADFVLVVARYGRATHAQIERCLGVVAEKKLTGIVFNDEPASPWSSRDGDTPRADATRAARGPGA